MSVRRGADRAVWLPFLLASLFACGEPGETVALRLHVASVAAPGAAQCPDGASSLLEEARCLRVTACRVDGDACLPVSLTGDARDPSAVEGTSLLQPLQADGVFQVDARALRGGAYRVTAQLFDAAGEPLASGTRTITSGAASVDLALFPARRSACAAPLNRARAFHQALALPSGDVLIAGGVTATEPLSIDLTATGTLASEVEVYLASEDRFVVLKGVQLRRIGFDARVIAHDEREVRVRVFGGMTTEPGQRVLRLDPSQSLDESGAPLMLDGTARPADVVDLVLTFGPQGVAAVLETPETAETIDAMVEGARGVDGPLVGGVQMWTTGAGESPVLSGHFLWLDAGGGVTAQLSPLVQPRWGAAVARFAHDDDSALVLGGNVMEASAVDVAVGAAEWITAEGRATLAAPSGDFRSTALSQLTPLSSGALLRSGGVSVGCPAGCAEPTGFGARMAEPAADVLLRSGNVLQSLPVSDPGGAYRASVFHATTSVVDDEGVAMALLSGGARLGADALQPFETLGQLAAVWLAQPGRFAIGPPPQLDTGAGLIAPRFGHAIAPLTGQRVLVVGGLTAAETGVAIVTQTEVLSLGSPPAPISAAACLSDAAD